MDDGQSDPYVSLCFAGSTKIIYRVLPLITENMCAKFDQNKIEKVPLHTTMST